LRGARLVLIALAAAAVAAAAVGSFRGGEDHGSTRPVSTSASRAPSARAIRILFAYSPALAGGIDEALDQLGSKD
jgi:hypothetical protein